MLEETGLPYEAHLVDIERGEQKAPAFLAMNPNGKIPVIVDRERGGRAVFESGAILFYLAARSGVLRPESEDERTTVLQWALFQAAHVGPMMGQLWNYKVFADQKIPYVIGRFEREVGRVLGVLDAELARREYVAGPRYGIADVMTWPWVDVHGALGLTLDAYPNLKRWHAAVGERPAVRRGARGPEVQSPHEGQG